MLARTFAPRTVYRYMQGMHTDGLRSITNGNQLISDLSQYQKFLHAFGLEPIEVQKAYDISSDAHSKTEARRRLIQSFGEAEAQAVAARDWEMFHDIRRKEILMGLPLASTSKSRKSRLAKRRPGTDMISRREDFKTRREIKRIYGDR